jgi:Ca2+:H+ antiporter
MLCRKRFSRRRTPADGPLAQPHRIAVVTESRSPHHWTTYAPLAAAAILGTVLATGEPPWLMVLSGVALVAAVLAAVHHAEVIAHRVGEPLGTLVLALAITVIEATLILALLLAGGAGMETLARDTVYATVMIITSGVIGLCTLIGGLAHREQVFRVEGAGGGLAALIVLAAITLVLPDFTITTPVGTYSRAQSLFAAAVSATLWGIFVFVQTVRHRDYFLPIRQTDDPDVHAEPPSRTAAVASFVLLSIALVAVVGLAKVLSHPLEAAVERFHLPRSVVGIAVAMVVLLPETWAAIRAARADRLQSSMNLALGSALATIGLTVPVVVIAAIVLDLPLVLGLGPKNIVLLATTLLVCVITVGTGRTSVMQGAVHLVLFATYLFLACVP